MKKESPFNPIVGNIYAASMYSQKDQKDVYKYLIFIGYTNDNQFHYKEVNTGIDVFIKNPKNKFNWYPWLLFFGFAINLVSSIFSYTRENSLCIFNSFLSGACFILFIEFLWKKHEKNM